MNQIEWMNGRRAAILIDVEEFLHCSRALCRMAWILCWFISLILLHWMACDDDIYGQSVHCGAKIAAIPGIQFYYYYCYHVCDRCLGSHTSEKRNYIAIMWSERMLEREHLGKCSSMFCRRNHIGLEFQATSGARTRKRYLHPKWTIKILYSLLFLLIAGCSWLPHSNPYAFAVNFNWRSDKFSLKNFRQQNAFHSVGENTNTVSDVRLCWSKSIEQPKYVYSWWPSLLCILPVLNFWAGQCTPHSVNRTSQWQIRFDACQTASIKSVAWICVAFSSPIGQWLGATNEISREINLIAEYNSSPFPVLRCIAHVIEFQLAHTNSVSAGIELAGSFVPKTLISAPESPILMRIFQFTAKTKLCISDRSVSNSIHCSTHSISFSNLIISIISLQLVRTQCTHCVRALRENIR